MSELHVIYGDGAQTLKVVAYDHGQNPRIPSGATYAINDLRHEDTSTDRAVVAAGTAATVDSFSQALSSAAGVGQADRTQIVLASVSGLSAGSQVFLEGPDDQGELVTIRTIDSANTTVYLEEELTGSYAATTSTLKGIEVSCTFPLSEADDEDEVEDKGGPYALDLVFTGVEPTNRRWIVWLRRHEWPVVADSDDVFRLDQTVATTSGSSLSVHRALDQAHRDFFADLAVHGIDASRFHGGLAAREAVTYRAGFHMRRLIPGWEATAEFYRQRYEDLRNQITIGVPPAGTVRPSQTEDTQASGSNTEPINIFGVP